MLEGRKEAKVLEREAQGCPLSEQRRTGWRIPTHFKHTDVQFGAVVARSLAALFCYIEIMSF